MSTTLRSNASPAAPAGGLPARLTVARVLTGLLEHLERSRTAVDAAQYRLVAQRLRDELAGLQPDSMLDAWMRGHPIATEMYENLTYEHAGLCRHPLSAALDAELAAKAAIARASAGSRSPAV